jgi:hypothetical protein
MSDILNLEFLSDKKTIFTKCVNFGHETPQHARSLTLQRPHSVSSACSVAFPLYNSHVPTFLKSKRFNPVHLATSNKAETKETQQYISL